VRLCLRAGFALGITGRQIKRVVRRRSAATVSVTRAGLGLLCWTLPGLGVCCAGERPRLLTISR